MDKEKEINELTIDNTDFLVELIEIKENSLFKGMRDLIYKKVKDPINKRLIDIEYKQNQIDKKLDKILKICEISMSENEKEALKAEYIQKLKELGVEVSECVGQK